MVDQCFKLQQARFEEVIPHFWKTRFYARKLEAACLSPSSPLALDQLDRIPFVTKEELRQTDVFERSPLPLEEIRLLLSSSGTTGTATTYAWCDEDDRVLALASQRAFDRLGVNSSDLALVIAPLGRTVVGYCMVSQYRVVGAAVVPLGICTPGEILDTMLAFPVTAVATLPVVAARLHEFAMVHQHPLPDTLRHFHFGGGFLSEARRHRIERAWNAEAFNLFGMSELFGPIAGESKQKNGLHLCFDLLFLEVVDPESGKRVPDGQPGVAVYTSLWHKGAPLLRYWSDDHVVVTSRDDQGICFKYLGRPHEMVSVNGRRLFASQVEQIILNHAVGNEYEVRLRSEHGKDFCQVTVEASTEGSPDLSSLNDHAQELFAMPVKVNVVKPGSLDRMSQKPKYLMDER